MEAACAFETTVPNYKSPRVAVQKTNINTCTAARTSKSYQHNNISIMHVLGYPPTSEYSLSLISESTSMAAAIL
jgi:hypothetical protein